MTRERAKGSLIAFENGETSSKPALKRRSREKSISAKRSLRRALFLQDSRPVKKTDLFQPAMGRAPRFFPKESG